MCFLQKQGVRFTCEPPETSEQRPPWKLDNLTQKITNTCMCFSLYPESVVLFEKLTFPKLIKKQPINNITLLFNGNDWIHRKFFYINLTFNNDIFQSIVIFQFISHKYVNYITDGPEWVVNFYRYIMLESWFWELTHIWEWFTQYKFWENFTIFGSLGKCTMK